MVKTPAGGDRPVEHGPLRAQRISPRDYTAQFLDGLKARNQVVSVDANWEPSRGNLPQTANWVIYPNGDIERVGFD